MKPQTVTFAHFLFKSGLFINRLVKTERITRLSNSSEKSLELRVAHALCRRLQVSRSQKTGAFDISYRFCRNYSCPAFEDDMT